jgi:acyl-CoA ligase (AMP-forming) (exosortase A-associated)
MRRLFHDLVDRVPAQRVHAPALRFRGQDVSYAALRESSERSAAGLAALGIGAGDRVAIYLGNRPEVVELALACSRIGAIFIPLSPLLRARQLEHVLIDSGASVLITAEATLPQALQAGAACPPLRAVVVADSADPASSGGTELPLLRLEDLRAHPPATANDSTQDTAAAAILYTSGSTGRSKGVVLSHRNLLAGASIVAGYLGNTPDDRLLAALPLSFDYGLSQVTTAFHVGACAVLTNFSLPATALQEIATEKITGLAGVPTMWAHLASVEWPREIDSHLRYLTNSGGALHSALIRQLRARAPGARVFSMYGLTEAFRSTFLAPADLEARPNSIGRAIPEQEVLVLREDGSRCDPDENGELVHCGSLVTLGYWGDPAATLHRFRPLPAAAHSTRTGDMAVWSGDIARRDEQGYLYFVGRADQMIKTSGYRVSPTEIEDVVTEVEGVIESSAVGIPDSFLGQKIALAVVGAAAGDETLVERIRRHCRMHLPLYMVPAEIHVMRAMPYNANGKPDRPALQQLLSHAS